MDRDTIRKHLAKDLPNYEIAPAAESLEDALADETSAVDANAGPLKAWRKVPVPSPVAKKVPEATSDLIQRFRKREL